MSDSVKRRFTIETWVQVAALLVAIIAVLATGYFSIRSDRVKDLSITYQSKPLFAPTQSAPQTSTLEMRIGNVVVKHPWLLTLRVENTGNIPIEERDIEMPLEVQFAKTKPLIAEIVKKSQAAIFGNAAIAGDRISLTHKLLNAGDWIDIQIVFDDEPSLPPSVRARISGVSQIGQRVSATDDKTGVPFLLLVSPAIRDLSYTIAASFGAALFFLGIASSRNAISLIGRVFFRRDESELQVLSTSEIGKIVAELFPNSPDLRLAHELIRAQLTLAHIDSPESILELLTANTMIQSSGRTDEETRQIANRLSDDLKERLRYSLGQKIYQDLPRGLDETQRQNFRKLDLSKRSALELVRRASEVFANPFVDLTLRQRLEYIEISIAAIGLICGMAIILSVGGYYISKFENLSFVATKHSTSDAQPIIPAGTAR